MSQIIINSPKAFILAIRPKTLGAILCPLLIGSAFAKLENNFSWFYFINVIICGLSLQILANLVNDYGDFIKGGDTEQRLGPKRVMQMGFMSTKAMMSFIAVIMLVISILGLILVFKAGIGILLLGILSLSLCLWYTLGPYPLAYLGFSEIFIWFFFGPLPALGAYYIQTSSLSWPVFFASLTPAFLSTALLLTNNLRDIQEDEKNHKKTLAVRFGEYFVRRLLIILLLLTFLSPIIVFFYTKNYVILLSLFDLITPLKYFKMILYKPISKDFNLLLANIGKTLYLYGIFFAISLLYGN